MNYKDYYLGKVKWFGGNNEHHKYGFITIPEFGDVYVNEKGLISGSICKDVYVICKVEESSHYNSKYSAYKVCQIASCGNIEVLMNFLFSNRDREDLFPYFIYGLKNNITTADSNYLNTIFAPKLNQEIISTFFPGNYIKVEEKIINPIKSILSIFEENNNTKIFSTTFNWHPFIKYVLMMSGPVHFTMEETVQIIKQYYSRTPYEYQSQLIRFSNSTVQNIIIKLELGKIYGKIPLEHLKYLLNKIDLLQNNQVPVESYCIQLYNKSDIEGKTLLWDLGYCLVLDELALKLYAVYLEENSSNRFTNVDASCYLKKIFSTFKRLNLSDSLKLLSSLHKTYSNLPLDSRANFLGVLINELKLLFPADHDKLRKAILPFYHKKEAIALWLKDFSVVVSLQDIKNEFKSLNLCYKVNIIKKLFSDFNNNSQKELISFIENVLREPDLVDDFEVYMALNIILIYLKNDKLSDYELINKITEHIAESTNFEIEPKASITTFFEKCNGRVHDDNGSDKPEPDFYCEGRKAKNNKTNMAIQESNSEFYWCRNSRCFRNSINLKTPDNWREYTLFHILEKINYPKTEDQYSYILGIINKVKKYLSNLQCRECKSWLKPVKESNYASARVNLFICSQPTCSESSNHIYINHCSNGKCRQIIDSRDSEKCTNDWYVCKYCFACCDTERIKKRIYILEKTKQTYTGSEIGHYDTDEIFCFKCGKPIKLLDTTLLLERHEKAKVWLESNNTDIVVLKQGLFSGAPWYLITKNENTSANRFKNILTDLRQIGYDVKKAEKNDAFFINEKQIKPELSLQCETENCIGIIHINDLLKIDRSKVSAMLYHRKIAEVYTMIMYKHSEN